MIFANLTTNQAKASQYNSLFAFLALILNKILVLNALSLNIIVISHRASSSILEK